jgi:chemotaxis protein CheC
MRSPTVTHLTEVFQRAAEEASSSLSKWLGRRTSINVKQVAAVPLERAVVMLGSGDEPLCVCAMHIHGDLSGILALAVSDESGLALADLLLGRDVGTSTEWGELERSAAAETTNIIGCAYLNAMATDAEAGDKPVLMPSPPWFVRDFPEAVMESMLVTQDTAAGSVFLTRTVFDIEETAIQCSLVFVPAATPADGDNAGPAGVRP